MYYHLHIFVNKLVYMYSVWKLHRMLYLCITKKEQYLLNITFVTFKKEL